MSLLILFFVVAIGFSFLCSLWEAVLLSVTPSYAQSKLRAGEKIGEHLQSFKEEIDRPLSAILTLNTIAHTVGAIGVGNQAAKIWADTNPLITAFVVPALMTIGILILSEIIPKTLGANNWPKLAPFTVGSLRVIIKLLAPFVWVSQLITRSLKADKEASVLSRSDFLAMAELGAKEGVIAEDESRVIANLLRFRTIRARDVMTPRTVMKAAPASMTIGEFHATNAEVPFSRIPIFAGASKDQIEGYVLKYAVLEAMVADRDDEELRALMRPVLVVPDVLPIPDLFTRMVEEREQIALVVDEFGGTAGLVTMEDVIETLLGLEIVDEHDRDDDMQALARQRWEKRARALGIIDETYHSPAAPDDGVVEAPPPSEAPGKG